MTILYMLLYAAASFLLLAVVFWSLERCFPAKPNQPIFRPAWLTDLMFFLGQYLLWGGLVLLILNWGHDWLNGWIPAGFRSAVAAQPWWLQAVEVVVLSDFLIYWGHRLQHRYDFLWRFHAVHHSAEHLDWLAAHREHPVDSVFSMFLINLPAYLLGFPIETLAGLIAFRGMWAIYIHSNVRLPLGPLKYIIGAPELHHWHHTKERINANYANLSPLMDVIFGTHHCPDHEPESLGIEGGYPNGYIGQMLEPFRKHKK
jgi:sterol desaturase/sphingolipid hydroxylase (fatty acid hydroxylase superfamily)